MSRNEQPSAGSSFSPPPSSAPQPITSRSSVELSETSKHTIWFKDDEALAATSSEVSSGWIPLAFESMYISDEEEVESYTRDPIGPGPSDSAPADDPADSQEDSPLLTPDVSTFDMDLGKFLMDRLDGHVKSKFPQQNHTSS